MVKLFTEIKKLKGVWPNKVDSIFLDYNLLYIFDKTHKSVQHLFFYSQDFILYSSIFTISFNKANNYLTSNFIIRFLLNFLRMDVLYLGNPFVTNTPSFSIRKDYSISFNDITDNIKYDYSLIVIPDFLYKNLNINTSLYTKIEVEDDMVLDIRGEWNDIDDYIKSLKRRYRKKVNTIISKTKGLVIKRLDVEDVIYYNIQLKNLFDQVISSSNFHGPKFNVDCLKLLVENNLIYLYGYFLKDDIIGFSSEIEDKNDLYSYYVGFDKKINVDLPIYGRMLIEMISHAINSNRNRLVLGRTANEYKSNFGAKPINSHVFISVRNRFALPFFKLIFSRIRVGEWAQRRALKEIL